MNGKETGPAHKRSSQYRRSGIVSTSTTDGETLSISSSDLDDAAVAENVEDASNGRARRQSDPYTSLRDSLKMSPNRAKKSQNRMSLAVGEKQVYMD